MPKIGLKQAHDYSGLSRRTIRRYIDLGMLPAYRLGTTLIRVDTDDLDALFKPMPTGESGDRDVC